MKINEKTMSKIGEKVIPVLLWIVVPMCFLGDILIIQELIQKWAIRSIIDKFFIIFGLSLIFLFACLLLTVLIKHKKLLLSKNKNILENKFGIFLIIFSIYMIVFSATEIIFYKNWNNAWVLIIGVVLLLTEITRRYKEKKKGFSNHNEADKRKNN